MKLEDFDEKFTEPDMADVDEIPIMRSDVKPEEIKSYLAEKLREFGEKLRIPKQQRDVNEYGQGYNQRNDELNTQIDKELSELE